MDYLLNPWPWYISGPLIGTVMFLLVYFGKTFGMSSNLRTACTILGAGKKVNFFNFNWRANQWNLIVVLGAIIGGFIAQSFLSNPTDIDLNPSTVSRLHKLGFANIGKTLIPQEIFGWTNVLSFKGLSLLISGGLLIGFGTRYAGGCTSGHAITGLSSLQLPSLIAVIGFFIGGLLMSHFLFPLLF